MSERNDAYRIKLYQDEVARCVHRLFDEGHAATLNLMDVPVRDPESGIVVTTPKPGFRPPVTCLMICCIPSNCFSSRFTSTTSRPQPAAIRFFRLAPKI